MKAEITPVEKLQLIGLLTLAAQHAAMLERITDAMAELLGGDRQDRDGHIMDAIYDDGRRDVDRLLERLEIQVVSDGDIK